MCLILTRQVLGSTLGQALFGASDILHAAFNCSVNAGLIDRLILLSLVSDVFAAVNIVDPLTIILLPPSPFTTEYCRFYAAI
jgi:hypothetical protein